MARTHAAIRLDIWGDDDWRGLSLPAQAIYLHLLSSPTLSYTGVADWRPARIAGMSAGTTRADVESAADELEAAMFVIRDEETEEILIRSFLKHDGLLHKPNVAKAMVKDYTKTVSATLRGVIVHELGRLHRKHPEWKAFDVREVADLLDKPAVDPSAIGKAKGSGKGSVKGSQVDPSLLTPSSLLPAPSTTHHSPSEISNLEPERADVLSLCNLLADLIEGNGSKRPKVSASWLNAARLMLDRDGRELDRAERLLRWTQDNDFWRANILSMPKFREKYDQLRLQAEKERTAAAPKLSNAQRGLSLVDHYARLEGLGELSA